MKLTDITLIEDLEAYRSCNGANFDTRQFLFLVKFCARNLGYIPFAKNSCPLDVFATQLSKANKARSPGQMLKLCNLAGAFFILFDYYHKNLGPMVNDETLIKLIKRAILERTPTTAEEQHTETLVFSSLINNHEKWLAFFAEHFERMQFTSIDKELHHLPPKLELREILEKYQLIDQLQNFLSETKPSRYRLFGNHLTLSVAEKLILHLQGVEQSFAKNELGALKKKPLSNIVPDYENIIKISPISPKL